jgi:(p)ppGpp synthase/HD superfamily hydrolase
VLEITSRFTQAVDYARQIHTGYRKGTQVPYLAHLLGVTALVLGESGWVPFAVTEDMLVGALLHDAVEDAGGLPRLRDIEANFGPTVARIVEGLSDSFEVDSDRKLSWESRKKAYVERLPREADDVLLVSLADKLYNARAILEDYREIGPEVWKRFKRGRREQLWYFDALIQVFKKRCPNWRILQDLKRVVAELERISSPESQGT